MAVSGECILRRGKPETNSGARISVREDTQAGFIPQAHGKNHMPLCGGTRAVRDKAAYLRKSHSVGTNVPEQTAERGSPPGKTHRWGLHPGVHGKNQFCLPAQCREIRSSDLSGTIFRVSGRVVSGKKGNAVTPQNTAAGILFPHGRAIQFLFGKGARHAHMGRTKRAACGPLSGQPHTAGTAVRLLQGGTNRAPLNRMPAAVKRPDACQFRHKVRIRGGPTAGSSAFLQRRFRIRNTQRQRT